MSHAALRDQTGRLPRQARLPVRLRRRDCVDGRQELGSANAPSQSQHSVSERCLVHTRAVRGAPEGKTLAVGQTNTFTSDAPTIQVVVQFKGSDSSTYASQPFQVEELPDLTGLQTEGDGTATIDVPVTLLSINVTFPNAGTSHSILIADMDPINTLSGIFKRLQNLGCICQDAVFDENDLETLRAALRTLKAVPAPGPGSDPSAASPAGDPSAASSDTDQAADAHAAAGRAVPEQCPQTVLRSSPTTAPSPRTARRTVLRSSPSTRATRPPRRRTDRRGLTQMTAASATPESSMTPRPHSCFSTTARRLSNRDGRHT